MPCSTPSNTFTGKALTTPYHHHHALPGGLFGVTLTPPRHVPPPIKETRIKAKDSLDIFRRRIRKNGNNYRDNVTCKTPAAAAAAAEEEEEAAAAAAATLWANWSFTMSPVSLLTHLANEFMVENDASPSPNRCHPFRSRMMMRDPAGRRVIDVCVQQEEEYSNTSGMLAEARRQGMDMSELARKKENVDSNQSITDEYLKVFEDEQNDEAKDDTISSNRPFRLLPYPIQPTSSLHGPSQGLERYKVVYDENKVIVPLTGSPEEWEWDRLLEEMENNDNKR
ncbi:hypothetical protein D1P53_002455 [Cryptococcus gattii VGV]|nr:hypothetical protein D1P53_002455 [Cryptococcus gattii VGV]